MKANHPNMQTSDNIQSAQKSGFYDIQTQRFRVAIVGSGCTGLRIAHLLSLWQREQPQQRSVDITFFESAHRSGGLIETKRHDSGLKIETAAQGVLASRDVFLQTLEDLGFAPQDVITPPTDKNKQLRFVISPRGRMSALTGPLSLIRGKILSIQDFLRALTEIFRARPQIPEPDETLYQFFARRFGRAVAENLVLPMATGIWGGGAEQLLARHAFPLLPDLENKHGSVIRGLIARRFQSSRKSLTAANRKYSWPKGLISFPRGMQTLIEAFEASLKRWSQEQSTHFEIKLSHAVQSLSKSNDSRILINGEDVFDYVFWTPAPWQVPNLNLNHPDAQQEWTHWQNTPAHSLIVVNVSGPRNSSTKDGFGVLARRESDGLLGVLFVHSIYPEHAPANQYSYRVLLGGDRNPELVNWSDEQITLYTLKELSKLGLISPDHTPADVTIVRWSKAVGIADHQHDERQKSLWRIQAYFPKLFFAGIYQKGVGVADALQSAQDCVQAWKKSLNQ